MIIIQHLQNLLSLNNKACQGKKLSLVTGGGVRGEVEGVELKIWRGDLGLVTWGFYIPDALTVPSCAAGNVTRGC